MQCPNCQRRVKRNKDGTIPKHYIEEFPVFGWVQKECPAVGSANGYGWSNYQASSSTMRCPCCNMTVGKKKDGRMRAHNINGRECTASEANR